MRDLMAARWGGVLGEWDELPRHKQVDVVALYEVGWRMDAINNWEATMEARRKHG